METKQDAKSIVKKIVECLPKTNCGKCGYDNCGKFARAVAEGNASPFGCRENIAAGYRISKILGIEPSPQQVETPLSPEMMIGANRNRNTRSWYNIRHPGCYRRGGRGGRSRKGHKRVDNASLWYKIKQFFGYI